MASDPSRSSPLKVAVLVDLARRPGAGGHVKCWERFARAATAFPDLDLTVIFSGSKPFTETLSPNVRLMGLRPVFSTERLPFLGHVPDHTDLAPWHKKLAHILTRNRFDVIHTTDAFFAYARTAERVAARRGIPFISSIHTDTPTYAEIFTRRTIENLLGRNRLSRWLIEDLRLPEKQRDKMLARMTAHFRKCASVIASNDTDLDLAQRRIAATSPAPRDRPGVGLMRLGCEREIFRPDPAASQALRARYGIGKDTLALLFAGRLDEGKNAYTLGEAVAAARNNGADLHLIAAGTGPAGAWLAEKLGPHVTLPGMLPHGELAGHYAGVDLLTLPSEVETWSMAATESLACGTPVLAAESSGAGRFITDPATGLAAGAIIADSRNPATWAEALTGLARHRETLSAWRAAVPKVSAPWVLSWEEALRQDLLPIWQQAARQ